MSSNFNMSWTDDSFDNGNTQYLNLKSGENRVRVVGSPSRVEVHWEKTLDGSKKKIVCLGNGCPICKCGHSPQIRYQVKVIDRTDNSVKILECGPQIIKEIRKYALDSDYGDLSKYDIKIIKTGVSRDTNYSVVAVPTKSDLTADEQKMVDESISIEDFNKIRTVEELYEMQLECLADSMSDLATEDNDDLDDFDDWDNL